MTKNGRILLFGGLILVSAVVGRLIMQKEAVITGGTTMLLQLAPVDPRSLMQGDYMMLDYAIGRNLPGQFLKDGVMVVSLDGNGVASFARFHAPGAVLAPGEHLLRYRVRSRFGVQWRGRLRGATPSLTVGSNAFYFQEGTASRYSGARYGEIRVSASGDSVLIGLRDGDLKAMGGESSQR